MGVPLTLLLGGDVMTGRGIDQVLAHPGDPLLQEEFVHDARDYVRLAEQVNGAIPRGVDAACVWGDALDQLRRADLSGATARRLADDLARQRRRGDLALLSIHWGGNWGWTFQRCTGASRTH